MPLELLSLPGVSWKEDAFVRNPSGNKLKKWGTVQDACEMLDDCQRELIYELIESGVIDAYKRRPRPNSHWVINLVSVWEHKQTQRKRA